MNKAKQKIALLGAVIYTAIIGAGMAVSFYGRGISYDNPKIMETMWLVEILATLWTLFLTVKYCSWKEVGFTKLNKKQMLWFIPSLLIVLIMLANEFYVYSTETLSGEQIKQIALICFTTLLVGFSEELMFRGILLNSFLEKFGKIKSILISSICFSLLHSVNVFAGLSFVPVLGQLFLTFLFGLFFALIFIRIKSIAPLMIFHWFWDFSVIANGVVKSENYLSFLPVLHFAIEVIIITLLFISTLKEENRF